jgi:thymidylate synthase (FAD)
VARIVVAEAEELLDVKRPVLDHGFVSLVDYMGGDRRIAEAAWVSSFDEVDAEKKTDKAVRRIIHYMLENDHGTPFEMVDFCFRVRLPIFVARQWIRHRWSSFNEASGRYRILPSEAYVPTQDRLQGKGTSNKQGSEGALAVAVRDEMLARFEAAQAGLYEDYAWFDEQGLANELCRLNLPLSQYTEWYWKVNLRSLFNFLKLRLHSHAQWEIRQYAQVVATCVKATSPIAWEAFEEFQLYAATFSRTEMRAVRALIDPTTSLGARIEIGESLGKRKDNFTRKILGETVTSESFLRRLWQKQQEDANA